MYNMRFKTDETKVMVVSKDININGHFHDNGFQIQTVTTNHLGIQVNDKWGQSQEIQISIENVLCNKKRNLQLRTRTLKCYIFSV